MMEVVESNDVGKLAFTLLPLVVGPLATWAAKKIMPTIPAAWKPILSAIIGAFTAAMTGGQSVVADVAVGAGLGLGGAKARDLLVHKPGACVAADPINKDVA